MLHYNNNHIKLTISESRTKQKIQKVHNYCIQFFCGIRLQQRVSNKLGELGWLTMFASRTVDCKYNIPPYLHKNYVLVELYNRSVRKNIILIIHREEQFK